MEFQPFLSLNQEMQKTAWEIYEYSFPSYEKRSFQVHQKALGDPRFHGDVVFDETDLVGILFYWQLEKYAYIEHFAISKELRGENYGTRILQQFCEIKKDVILEIDPPVDAVSVKREHFYHRLGFLTSSFSYTHPSYGDAFIPHTLVLMSYPKAIAEKDFENFKSLMFKDIMKYSGK